ncbi:MAG TPA: hypothetical protein VM915_06940, partial [Verrucomicrobiae bacterium]|nr:hypothetical protein [Verrucomicrobiae bacterium]
MSSLSAVSTAATPRAEDDLTSQLEAVRERLETAFTEAGGLLEQSLGVIDDLIANLQRLESALGAEAAGASISDLNGVADALSALPAAQARERASLQALAKRSTALAFHTEDMSQSLRYLRAFALNVKVAGADIVSFDPEFSNFAQEMLDRIDQGGGEMESVWAHIRTLNDKVKNAESVGDDLSTVARGVLPHAPERLKTDAAAIAAHNRTIAHTSANVAEVARRIQMNVAIALSALQIGDTTRQRIEHVQYGLLQLENLDPLLTADSVPQIERDHAKAHLRALLAAQMEDLAQVFEEQAGRVMTNAAALGDDTAEIVRLQSALAQDENGGLRDLETSVAEVMKLVRKMDAATGHADQVRRETGKLAIELVHYVDGVRAVKDDVHFMALNTTLRSARIGERGRPIQVIATELRAYAGKLDEAAAQTLA